MTESEWISSTDPAAMLRPFGIPPRHISESVKISDRKLRLLCCALYQSSNHGLLQTDRYGRFNYGNEGERISRPTNIVSEWVNRKYDYDPSNETKCNIIREIISNPYHPLPEVRRVVRSSADMSTAALESGASEEVVWTAPWLTSTVLSLAQAAYDQDDSDECTKCRGTGKELSTIYDQGYSDSTAVQVVGYSPIMNTVCPKCKGRRYISNDGTLDPNRLLVLSDALEEAGCTEESILYHLRSNKHYKGCWVIDLLLGKE